MLHDLFINMLILISFVSIGSQVSRKYDISVETPIRIKVVMGLITGLLGIVLMLFTVHIDGNTIIDFRNVAIVIATYYGGSIPLIICGLLIAFFRGLYFGVSLSSIYAFLSVILIVTGHIFINKINIKGYAKWVTLVLYTLIISSTLISLLLVGKDGLIYILFVHCSATIIVSTLSYNYINYCFETNTHFRRLKEEATKDFLTGLNNVRQFDNLYNATANQAIRKNESISLLMIDIDFFKKVNDTYGHANGDKVLIDLGIILSDSCRNYDIVSRNGGEEFTILLIDCGKDEAIKIAEKIRGNVELHYFELLNHKKINLTISIGVASFPESTNDYEKLLEMSDMALYNAKRSGRNKVSEV